MGAIFGKNYCLYLSCLYTWNLTLEICIVPLFFVCGWKFHFSWISLVQIFLHLAFKKAHPSIHKIYNKFKQDKNLSMEKRKWTQSSTPNREAICNWYPLGKKKISSLQQSDTGLIKYTPGQAQCPEVAVQQKIDSMSWVWLPTSSLSPQVLHFCFIWVFFWYLFICFLFAFWGFCLEREKKIWNQK